MTEDWQRIFSGVAITTATLAVLLWIVYGIWGSWRTVALTLPMLALLAGLPWGVGQLTGLSYDRAAHRQPFGLIETASTGITDLRDDLRGLSGLAGGGIREMRVDLVLPADVGDPLIPTLRWALRDFSQVRLLARVPSDPAFAVITPVEQQPALSDRYGGAEYAALQQWHLGGLNDFRSWLRWVFYREAKTPPEVRKVVLWVNRSSQAFSSAPMP